MKIVALLRTPADPAAAVAALVEAAGLTAAEARMRLAPEPPALLVRLAPDAADALVAKLRAKGLSVLAVGEVPSDAERIAVRSLEFQPTAIKLAPRSGDALTVPWTEVLAILRGSSSMRSQSEHTERSKQFDLTGAIVSGGIKLTKTTERTVRSNQEDIEQSIFVYARGGESAILRETALDFSFLGKELQPARTANMTVLAQKLRQAAPAAFYDERLLRLGRRPLPFVTGGDLHVATRETSMTRTNTASGLDVLAEVMRQAVAQKLLP